MRARAASKAMAGFGAIQILLAGCKTVMAASSLCGIELPPPSVIGLEPKKPIVEFAVPASDVEATCLGLTRVTVGAPRAGCALLGATQMIAVYPKPDQDTPAMCSYAVLAHEKYGHGNGLSHDETGRGWFDANGTRIVR